jgi:uncharacterized membrane protein YcaP (DUF421 family)
MDAVLRATAVYVVLLLLFRVSGKRSMAQVTTFDLVLVLVVGEATQQALLGEDFSVVQAAIVITTLIGLDRLADYVSWRSPAVDRVLQSVPVVLLDDGELLEDVMRKVHVSKEDILGAARSIQGLERLDQIRYAVLEPSGGISVIPKTVASNSS